MPQSATPLTTSFDLTFGPSFQGLLPRVPPIAPDPCRMRGVYLYWLNRYGWCGYLFQSKHEKTKESRSVSTFQNEGLTRDTQRITTSGRLVRAGNLTEAESEVVSSIVDSIAVFALAPNQAQTKIIAAQVYVDPAKLKIWDESVNRIGIEISYSLPTLRSQRA